MKVHEAIAAVMGDVQAVAKRDRNTHQNFNFRGIDAVMNAVAPALRKHGVVVLPNVESWTFEPVEVGQKRSLMGHALVHVTYTFVGPEGDHVTCSVLGEAMDSGDKAVPKAMSVALRTALLQALALPTDEPDPDSETYVRSERTHAQDVTHSVPSSEQIAALEALYEKAADLVDVEQVRQYAAQSNVHAQASIDRLVSLIDKAERGTVSPV